VKKIATVIVAGGIFILGLLLQVSSAPVPASFLILSRELPSAGIFRLPEAVQFWDISLFETLNSRCGSFLDFFLAWPTYLGATAYLLLTLLLFMFLWDSRCFINRFGFILAVLLLQEGSVAVLKRLFGRLRPFMDGAAGPHAVQVMFTAPSSYSFPSGHAAAGFAAVTLLCGIYGLRRLWPLYVPAALIAVSRVYIGVHYPLDILAGALFGLGWAACFLRAGKSFYMPKRAEKP